MAFTFIRHQVSDYVRWRDLYDKDRPNRIAHGSTHEQVFHASDDPEQVSLLLQWGDLEEARRYLGSEELKRKMQEAGVLGEPELVYLEQIDDIPIVGSAGLNEQRLIQVARALMDNFNHHDVEKSMSLISENAQWIDVAGQTVFPGKEGYRQFEENWLRAFPDGRIVVNNLIASGDQVIVEYVGRGTHLGPLESPWGTLEPSGESVVLPLCDVMQFENGQVIRGHTYYDADTLIRQLKAGPQVKAA